jgi:hypothetical protein
VTDAEALRRFIRAAATLEPEVARWIGALVWAGLTPSRRRRLRDDLLREAARRLPPVSAWQKAHRIADLARRADARPDVSTAAGLVALAAVVYRPERRDREISQAQVFRVIVSRIPPMEMQFAADAQSNSMLGIFPEQKDGEDYERPNHCGDRGRASARACEDGGGLEAQADVPARGARADP